MSNATDVVVLIPGFLAFDKLGKHSYFAETVAKAIESDLANPVQPGVSFEILAVDAPPVDSLVARQAALLGHLRSALERNPAARLHLFGHSTGGLDAELLTRATGLGGNAWTDTEREVRAAIRSITTIASPLSGTTLAESPLARVFAIDSAAKAQRRLRDGTLAASVLPALKLVTAGFQLLWDRAFLNVLDGIVNDRPVLGAFLYSVVRHHALIADLMPEHVVTVMSQPEDPLLAGIHRARILTVAPESIKRTPEGGLYDLLYSSTKDAARNEPSPAFLPQLQARFKSRKILPVLDRARLEKLVDTLGPTSSDGVVNTLRQLPPHTRANLDVELQRVIAIALADHLDVVGYYPNNTIAAKPRARLRRDGSTQNGFLESGAHFRDNELRALYGLVAYEIRRAIAEPR
jgi:pimeloyl-ACP methyl ester carboxylesterase